MIRFYKSRYYFFVSAQDFRESAISISESKTLLSSLTDDVIRAADEIPNSHSSRRGRLVCEGKVPPANMSDVKRAKYSLSVQGQPDWCHFCKCYVQSHSNSKRNHEQSNAHK